MLQRGVRGRLARRGLCKAVAAGAAVDARTCIRALLLREHAPKRGGIEWSLGLEWRLGWRLGWSEHGQSGCSGAADRAPGEQGFGVELGLRLGLGVLGLGVLGLEFRPGQKSIAAW